MKLTASNVRELVLKALHAEGELSPEVEERLKIEGASAAPEGSIYVEGIVRPFLFHAGRLEKVRADVQEMIGELPEQFLSTSAGGGGGWSFLNLPVRRGDPNEPFEHWPLWGEQPDAGDLYALAAGLGMARFQLPRAMWGALPGGVPYVEFNPDGFLALPADE